MNETQTTNIDLLKLSVSGYEGRILIDMFGNNIFPKIICVEWDGYLNSLYSIETLENVYLKALIDAGYELLYDNENLKHTFIKLNIL
jgi:hypothetical protein